MTMNRIIISGGGTGGHIFPAIAIADEIKARYPECKILFVGAKGRMEEDKVPAAGYEILLLPIKGLERKKVWKNIHVAIKLLKSIAIVRKTIKQFKPDAVVGVGGYASAPTLMAAQQLGIPTLIQEQNSYAGVTNKLVAKKAKAICVAYEGMEKFFPKETLHLTGNPLRKKLMKKLPTKEESAKIFGLSPHKKTLLVVGGSLGALNVNKGVAAGLEVFSKRDDVQLLWQTGTYYHPTAQLQLSNMGHPSNIKATPFISNMDNAYALADVIVSRAGASSISEITALCVPPILVPSPNVAEDHQTHNAMALVKNNAAIMVKDSETEEKLIPAALELLGDDDKRASLRKALAPMGKHEASQEIVDLLENMIKEAETEKK